MKHIKTFESKKEISNIEDLLLFFVDRGEIAEQMSVYEYKEYYKIIIQVNNNIIGFDKLKLYDSMIERLKKRFTNIYIHDGRMYIDKIGDGDFYIKHSLYQKAKDFVDDKFKNLNAYSTHGKMGVRYYGVSTDDILLAYYTAGEGMFVNYNKLWMPLVMDNILVSGDIRYILKTKVKEILNLDVVDINNGIPERPEPNKLIKLP